MTDRHLRPVPAHPRVEQELEAPRELPQPEIIPGDDAVPLEEIHRLIRRSRLRVVDDVTRVTPS